MTTARKPKQDKKKLSCLSYLSCSFVWFWFWIDILWMCVVCVRVSGEIHVFLIGFSLTKFMVTSRRAMDDELSWFHFDCLFSVKVRTRVCLFVCLCACVWKRMNWCMLCFDIMRTQHFFTYLHTHKCTQHKRNIIDDEWINNKIWHFICLFYFESPPEDILHKPCKKWV